ncbi:MAG: hypothetical protein M5U29_07640 [Anaerolineae bacterium]|nr:hypothetical protein [Anaerolineae bacterium]
MGDVVDPATLKYLENLPEVDTARLPVGTLFWAEGRIYQVIEAGTGGYHKAREWRKPESTDVALVPGSFPSRYLPLVRRGRVLPVYRSRLDLTRDDRATCFIFPTETLALDAAYLDVALIISPGAYVRNQGQEPAFAATDGAHVFRLYYYRQSVNGRQTDLSVLQVRPLPFRPQPHTEGPGYWCLLPGWLESLASQQRTQSMRAVGATADDDTLPRITLPPRER